jgi:hypothetical protein
MVYEIWDVGTSNLVDSFITVDEALDAVRKAVDHHGPRVVSPWTLTAKDLSSGRVETLAHGRALVRRAFLTPA